MLIHALWLLSVYLWICAAGEPSSKQEAALHGVTLAGEAEEKHYFSSCSAGLMSRAVLQQGWQVWVCCCACLAARGAPCWAEHNENLLRGGEVELQTHLKSSEVLEESKETKTKLLPSPLRAVC